jgi:phenylpyruvate tautomerase PptA (4-oxalocrotonate tautomerase family)
MIAKSRSLYGECDVRTRVFFEINCDQGVITVPISVQVTKGLLTSQGERQVVPLISDALLKAHGLSGNSFMTPNVIGHLMVTPESESYAGGQPQSLAVIEIKVPSVTFPNAEVCQTFISEVTDIIDRLKAGTHPRQRTFVNVTYAVNGAWGIGGRAYSNDELGAAIQQAASA